MNSLKLINEEIEKLKTFLELDDVLCELSDNEYKLYNDRLQTLQYIKNELEAWYVVKPNIRFEEHSRAWIYLDRISQDSPSYRVIEKSITKNNISSTTLVIKEGNKITVKREEVTNND